MRLQCIRLMLLLGLTVAAVAQQETPKVEVFGGYSYAKMSLSDEVLPTRAGLNGWNAEFGWNFNQWLGLTGDFSGYYGGPVALVTFKPPDCVLCTQTVTRKLSNEYNFLLGPKISAHRREFTFFGHALFGRAQFHESGPAFITDGFTAPPSSGASFALALGGGVDVGLGHYFAMRLQSDYIQTHFSGTTQHDFRLSTGPVLRFGS